MGKWSGILVRAVEKMAEWCYYIGSFFLLVMALSTTYEVVMRYFFMRPTIWSKDLNENLLVYATFFAAAWILRRERHVAINIVTDRLRPRGRRFMNTLASLLGAFTCIILMWQTLDYTLDLFQSGELHIRSTVIPKWVSWAPIPFGSGLLTIYFLRRAYISFRGSGAEVEPEPMLEL